MSKYELMGIRNTNFKKLDLQSYRPKINAIELDIGNTLRHEMSKVIVVWLIRHGYAASSIPQLFGFGGITEKLHELEKVVKTPEPGFTHWQVPQVVTEARFIGGKRRADVFILDTGEVIEVETNRKVRKLDASETIYV